MIATCQVHGTIQDASGVGVEGVVARLTPAPRDPATPEAIGGIAILSDPVEVQTDEDGVFAINAVQGFRYILAIDGCGLNETFTCPAVKRIRFDLLGLVPVTEQARAYDDADGATHVLVTIRCPRPDTVRERFDTVSVERAPGIDGPWVEIETATVEAGLGTYDFDDTGGEAGSYYRARYIDLRGGLDVSAYAEGVPASDDAAILAITVDELKEIYLFGTDLTDDRGNPFPARMYDLYIRAAVAWLEKELDIPIVAVNIEDEVQDHYPQDYGSWGYFQLHNYPVIEITAVSFQYPSMTTAVDINLDWVVLEDKGAKGVVQIVPGQGNIADVLLIPGSLMPLWSGGASRVPGIWHFDYRAGFEVGSLPADLKHAIGMRAAIGVFNVAGDLVAGAGIANFSVSIPGLSQNVGTTSSATNAGYGARIIEYQKELKEMLPTLRRYYGKGVRMVVA